jgi:GNAT superfamily N-acetyltransferase
MTPEALIIEHLAVPATDADLHDLAQLLTDAVNGGAAVSFLAPFTLLKSLEWWRDTVSRCDSRAVFLVARDGGGIVGTVQLHPAWAPNQPHRAEIAKLLVQKRRQRMGLGRRLMQAIEDEARRGGFRLLTLDAKRGVAAEKLYRQLGWIEAGMIPRFAFDPDGITPHDAVIFYKELK